MKFKLILRKEYNIDTKVHWGNDHSTLIEVLRDKLDVAPGTEADSTEIHDAIREMLSDDIEYVVDLSIDETDFEIEIPAGTTIEVPDESAGEDDAA